jgi:hypothetical protein
MPGPPPKAPGLRARRNKASTRARLGAAARGVRTPALPIRGCPCGGPKPEAPKRKGPGRPTKKKPPCDLCDDTGVVPWNTLTVGWWRRLWSSPMAGEFIESDIDPLYTLASLKDEFWTRSPGDPKLAAEIRQQEARFGLTPLDRRRLEWEIQQEEKDQDGGDGAPPTSDEGPRKPVEDPRTKMRLVG